MKDRYVFIVVVAAVMSLAMAACASQAAPAPTTAPAAPPKAAEPTKAPAAQPTAAPTAAPTSAPAKTTFPEKGRSITVVVPWAPGGSTDVGARLVAAAMEKTLGVANQIVNKEGASSQVGVTEVAKSKPDGYTIVWTNLPSSMSPYLDPSRQAQYGRKDLAQIANFVADPEVFAVKPESKYKTLKDLVDDAKARPGQVNVSITGIGSDNHVALLMFQEMIGTTFNIVNLQSGAPAITGLLGGNVEANFQTLGNYTSQLKSGAVRFLAIATEKRETLAPDIPTMKEQGYNIVFASSRGISGPAGIPKDVVNVLSAAAKKAGEDPAVKAKFDEMVIPMMFLDADGYTKYWDDFEKMVKPIQDRVLLQQKTK